MSEQLDFCYSPPLGQASFRAECDCGCQASSS